MTVLSMAGETECVWKAAISALGFVAMGGAEASRPLAANMMFGLYFNLQPGSCNGPMAQLGTMPVVKPPPTILSTGPVH